VGECVEVRGGGEDDVRRQRKGFSILKGRKFSHLARHCGLRHRCTLWNRGCVTCQTHKYGTQYTPARQIR